MKTKTGGSGYEIKLKGHLDARWQAWFEGWSITNLENGEVLLKNTSVDQAGLHGALDLIRDLNLMLMSVKKSEEREESDNEDNWSIQTRRERKKI